MGNTFAPVVTPQISVFSEGQLDQIHLASLEVLRRSGIRFFHEGALEMLRYYLR